MVLDSAVFQRYIQAAKRRLERLFTYFLARDDYRALTHSDHFEMGSKLRDSSCSQRFGGGQGRLSEAGAERDEESKDAVFSFRPALL